MRLVTKGHTVGYSMQNNTALDLQLWKTLKIANWAILQHGVYDAAGHR